MVRLKKNKKMKMRMIVTIKMRIKNKEIMENLKI